MFRFYNKASTSRQILFFFFLRKRPESPRFAEHIISERNSPSTSAGEDAWNYVNRKNMVIILPQVEFMYARCTCRCGQEASSVGSSSSGSNSGFSLGGRVRKIFTEIWKTTEREEGGKRVMVTGGGVWGRKWEVEKMKMDERKGGMWIQEGDKRRWGKSRS